MGEVVEFPRPETEDAATPKRTDRWHALHLIAVAIDGRPGDPMFLRQALRAVLQIFPSTATDAKGRCVGLFAAALLRAVAEGAPPEGPRSA